MKKLLLSLIVLLVLAACTSREDKLITALKNDNTNSVEKILSDGVSTDMSKYNENPIEIAVQSDEYSIVVSLIEAGFQMPPENKKIINQVIQAGRVDVIKALAKKGLISPAYKIPDKGYSVYYWVSTKNSLELLKLLSTGEQDCGEWYNGTPVLFNIVDKFGVEGLRSAINDKQCLYSRNKYGTTILGYAIANGNIDAIRYLLNEGATINNITDESSWYTIGNQWEPGFEEIFTFGTSGEVNLENADSSLITGMILNQKLDTGSRIKHIQYFIKNGVDHIGMDQNGMRPIDYAARLGYGPSISEENQEHEKRMRSLREYGDRVINLLSTK